MSAIFKSEFIALNEIRTQVSLTQENHTLMHNKIVYVDTFFKNAITCKNDNNDNNDNNLHAGALIQQDPNLISIDGSISLHARQNCFYQLARVEDRDS